MKFPAQRRLQASSTHRLIPARYSDGSVLAPLAAGSADDLQALFDLDGATNDRLLAEAGAMPGMDLAEFPWGVAHERVIRAAYMHPNPLGGRFNSPERGAWYCALAQETAIQEVAFHRGVELAEVGWWDLRVDYDDYLADFDADFHDIRGDDDFEACRSPDSYKASQSLAAALLEEGSNGIMFDSVRHSGGVNVACFRPRLIENVRKGDTLTFSWSGEGNPTVTTKTVPAI